uniref:Uncharacterized protein n=1 Tax=viral metagenome TaxID=1070528 RepID=A0A6M3JD28_9ZZZZ
MFDRFCPGCRIVATCKIHDKPKTWPVVSRFLSRASIAQVWGLQIYPADWRELTIREYRLLSRGAQVINRLDRERHAKLKRDMERGR